MCSSDLFARRCRPLPGFDQNGHARVREHGTTVVTAQVTALNARQTLSQLMSSRQAAVIALIQALGGGWHAPAAPGAEGLAAH